MLLNPFRILYELFVFALQAAFIYGLALIAAITFLIWVIAQHPQSTTVTEYVTEYVTVPVVEEVEEIENECLQLLVVVYFLKMGKKYAQIV